MRRIRLLAVLILPVLVLFGSQALTSEAFKFVTNIPIPGGVASNDIFWGDASLGRAFLADRTNSGVDTFDMRGNTFIGRIATGGGVGTVNAPNGVTTDSGNQLVFVGLGASGAGGGFLTANANTLSVIAKIPMTKPSGGPATGRSDELAADPALGVVLIANDQDSPPFVSEIAYSPAGVPQIIGQISLPSQTGCGIEQTVWVPETGTFWTALPTAGGCPGGIAVFSPSPFKLVTTITTDCSPAGLAHGPTGLMFVGCTPAPEVVSIPSGVKVAQLGNLPSSDEVWYDAGGNFYEFLIAAPTNTLNVFSAANNGLVETDQIGSPFHNLTADAVTQKVFISLDAGNPNCTAGCAAVFQPPAGPTNPTGPGLGVTCGGIFYPSGTTCGAGAPPQTGLGITCGGIFYPSGTFCGNTGVPTNAITPGIIGAPLPTPLGVTCSGIFYPSGTFCGKTGP